MESHAFVSPLPPREWQKYPSVLPSMHREAAFLDAYVLDIAAERLSGGAGGGGGGILTFKAARVSFCPGVSSPLHVSVLDESLRSMKIYVASIGASNQP